ncbi:NAD(P)-dependent oxidoreductase [Actinoallomurus liliacearum]|uniref:NAD-dependent epimerase/dehydratase family protein n=1 Tax=Actinoallomurus liliacearum TaxID=1080073 RepID=UPI0031E6C04E
MKILVTGAAGMLGREVVVRLVADGHSVRAYDRVAATDQADEAHEVIVGDLRDETHLAGALGGVDAVVHAAALPSPLSDTEHRVFTNNVESAYHVLDAAGRSGIGRIVNVSSLSAIGLAWARRPVSPESVPVTEAHQYVGEDVYGLSKYVGELIAATVSRRWGTTVVSLRFPFLGTGERLRHHLARVHADPGADAATLWGWLDTRDAAGAVAAALTRPLHGHVLINVAAPDTTALVPTAELLRRYHPATRIDAPLDGFEVPFSTRRSRELLGFTPVHAWRTTKGTT